MSTFNKSAKRKELNKLSEPKIIKQCKKYNIKIYKLSKKEMIDKLLIKFESKHNSKQKLKSIQKEQLQVTLIEQYAIITHGWARKYITSSQTFPDVIAISIAHYIQILRVIDTCPDEYKYAIQNYGTFINRKKHKSIPPNYKTGSFLPNTNQLLPKTRTHHELQFMKYSQPIAFGVSKGFERAIDTENKLCFKVKMYQNNIDDAVGIISELDCCYDGLEIGFNYNDFNSTHYLLRNDGGIQVYKGINTRFKEKLRKDNHKFQRKAGDVVGIEVNMDCKPWWIKFCINDELYGKMDIANRHTYYPVIFTTNSGQYQVLM